MRSRSLALLASEQHGAVDAAPAGLSRLGSGDSKPLLSFKSKCLHARTNPGPPIRDCFRVRHGVVGVSGMSKESRALGVIPGTLTAGGGGGGGGKFIQS